MSQIIALDDTDLEYAIDDVVKELRRAQALHGPMASHHEAAGVIEEEWLEVRSAIYWGVDQRGRPSDPHVEAIELAAMCLRYLIDVPRRPKAKRHVIRLIADGAGHDPDPICDACERPWPCDSEDPTP